MFVRHAPFAGQNRRQGRDEKTINKALRWRALLIASAKCVDWEMPSEMTTTRRNTENSRSRVCLKTARRLVSSFLFRGSWIFHAAYVQVKQKVQLQPRNSHRPTFDDCRRLNSHHVGVGDVNWALKICTSYWRTAHYRNHIRMRACSQLIYWTKLKCSLPTGVYGVNSPRRIEN